MFTMMKIGFRVVAGLCKLYHVSGSSLPTEGRATWTCSDVSLQTGEANECLNSM
jgi:hypothetical protein